MFGHSAALMMGDPGRRHGHRFHMKRLKMHAPHLRMPRGIGKGFARLGRGIGGLASRLPLMDMAQFGVGMLPGGSVLSMGLDALGDPGPRVHHAKHHGKHKVAHHKHAHKTAHSAHHAETAFGLPEIDLSGQAQGLAEHFGMGGAMRHAHLAGMAGMGRRRRMNWANPRALGRAERRLHSFIKHFTKTARFLGMHVGRAPRRHRKGAFGRKR